MLDRKPSLLPWWLVPGGLTALLLLYNSPWMRLYHQDLYRAKQWVFGLAFEMNAGVWWSSIIYLLSAALFYEVASGESGHRRRACLDLALLMLAVVIDEIGAFHEWVSGIGGWTALAPFGLLGVLLLVDALRLLWRDHESRAVFWLVLLGFLVLASVPVQEYAEHNLTTKQWSDWYGRPLEEATELVGAWLILFAAVYRRRGCRWGGPPRALVPDPSRMRWLLPIVAWGFLAHVIAAQAPLVEVGRWDGSPSAVYPTILFFIIACYAFWVPRHRSDDGRSSLEVQGFWSPVALFFLLCSLGTMQNLWGLVGRVIPGLSRRWFYEKVPLWILLLAVVSWIGLVLWQRRHRMTLWLLAVPLVWLVRMEVPHPSRKDLAMGLLACLCGLALMRSDNWAGPAQPIESNRGEADL